MVAIAERNITITVSNDDCFALRKPIQRAIDAGEVSIAKGKAYKAELVAHVKHCELKSCNVTQEVIYRVDEGIKLNIAEVNLLKQIIAKL